MNTNLFQQRVAACVETAILRRPAFLAAVCAAMLVIAGCQKTATTDAAKPSNADKATDVAAPAQDGETDNKKPASGMVTLSEEQMQKIGLQTEPAKETSHADETVGYGTVVPHESIAQAVAELATAQATEKQSRSALARSQRLSGTLGALSSDVEETNLRQAAVDAAALNLAKQRLSSIYGQRAPWANGGNQSVLLSLASGATQLVRATFPLGSLPGNVPGDLHGSRIGATRNDKRWKLTSVWPAPADASIPGRSFFALLRNTDVGEGERVIVWAPVGTVRSGILIPADAVVVREGKYWCYVEEKAGNFSRIEVDTGKPMDDGYFVTDAVKPGDKIVTKAVAQLLAQESNSGADAE